MCSASSGFDLSGAGPPPASAHTHTTRARTPPPPPVFHVLQGNDLKTEAADTETVFKFSSFNLLETFHSKFNEGYYTPSIGSEHYGQAWGQEKECFRWHQKLQNQPFRASPECSGLLGPAEDIIEC